METEPTDSVLPTTTGLSSSEGRISALRGCCCCCEPLATRCLIVDSTPGGPACKDPHACAKTVRACPNNYAVYHKRHSKCLQGASHSIGSAGYESFHGVERQSGNYYRPERGPWANAASGGAAEPARSENNMGYVRSVWILSDLGGSSWSWHMARLA